MAMTVKPRGIQCRDSLATAQLERNAWRYWQFSSDIMSFGNATCFFYNNASIWRKGESVVLVSKMGDDGHDCEVMIAHMCDSRRWRQINIRADDVLIGTYPKCGTTWMQQIVRSLLDIPDEGPLDEVSPWVDMRFFPIEELARKLEAQSHRRFLKHHLARHYLPKEARIGAAHVYVARDGRDMAFSLYNFSSSFKEEVVMSFNKSLPEGVKPLPAKGELGSVVDFFRHWLRNDGGHWMPFWEHIRSWWAARHRPNVLLVHYAALKRDATHEVGRVQRFLADHGVVRMGDDVMKRAVHDSSFVAMKKASSQHVSGMNMLLEGGTNSFFNKGTNGRWKDVLPDDLVREYEMTARRELGEECAYWLATGKVMEV